MFLRGVLLVPVALSPALHMAPVYLLDVVIGAVVVVVAVVDDDGFGGSVPGIVFVVVYLVFLLVIGAWRTTSLPCAVCIHGLGPARVGRSVAERGERVAACCSPVRRP